VDLRSNVWFLYVVECSDNTLYTGVTTDVSRRVHEHNTSKKGAKYTRSRRPVRVVYYDEFPDRSSALKAEHWVKKLSRKEKQQLVSSRILGLINETR
tara:strand:+ start:1606 stop:1896 length:291 start_codon:yes stop_codon:yes gene_type:complete